MTQSRPGDPPVPAKITEVKFDTLDAPDQFWADGDRVTPASRLPMSFSARMFNVGWKGWTRLALVCVIVGAIFQAGGFNPFAEGFTIGAGLGQIVNGVINIAGWAAQNGGLPLLLGALVVLPFWIAWRALVTLFNKDKPPSHEDRILPKERPRKKH